MKYSRYSGNGNSRNKYKGGSKFGRGNSRGNSRGNFRFGGSKIPHHKYIHKVDQISDDVKQTTNNSFEDFALHPQVLRNIIDRGYKSPTKIQDQAMPHILSNKDVLGIGRTGSGKTGAFLIPMINKAAKDRNQKVLIITPTRELASQIQKEFSKFTPKIRLQMTLVIGGTSIGQQISQLRNRPQFVVATPGRLLDLYDRDKINLKEFNNVVLDEVDQMLDMGFIKDIRHIISELSSDKQSLFFSATMSHREEDIARELLNDPIKIVSDVQEAHTNVSQDIVRVSSQSHKLNVLHEIIQQKDVTKVIVFSRTKRDADKISSELNKKGHFTDSLHGGKRQNVRKKVLTNFRQDKISILIATDVAARGIDIPDVSHVINYDEPESYNDYIHRIGRTGRLGNKGVALTFVLS